MCTILTVSSRLYTTYTRLLEERIRLDHAQNDDGTGLVLVGQSGGTLALRSLDIEPVLQLMRSQPWSRAFVHQRAATQGGRSLSNVHGWQSVDGWFYMHNGMLLDPQTRYFQVDSQLIGQWLDDGGPALALGELAREWYANVFLVSAAPDDVGAGYWVNRSGGGSLFTDQHGNYSTVPIVGTGIVHRVRKSFQQFHRFGYARRRAAAPPPQVVEPSVLVDQVAEDDRPALPNPGRVWAMIDGAPEFVMPSMAQPYSMFWHHERLVAGRRMAESEIHTLGAIGPGSIDDRLARDEAPALGSGPAYRVIVNGIDRRATRSQVRQGFYWDGSNFVQPDRGTVALPVVDQTTAPPLADDDAPIRRELTSLWARVKGVA